MTDRQSSELYARRQVYNRIKELKFNCDQLTQTRGRLEDRLRELNEVADRLILDKETANRQDVNLQLKPDLYGNTIVPPKHHNCDTLHERPSSRLSTNDLNQNNFPSSYSSNRYAPSSSSKSQQPSDAFKMKISFCLDEVLQKAEEVVGLSEHLSNNRNNFKSQQPRRKLQKNTHY